MKRIFIHKLPKKAICVVLAFLCVTSLAIIPILTGTTQAIAGKPEYTLKGDSMMKNGPFTPMCIEEMGNVPNDPLKDFTTDSKQVSINNVFGHDDRSTIYMGEVPPNHTEGVKDNWSNDHPSIGERWILGAFRTWSLRPTTINGTGEQTMTCSSLGWGEEGGNGLGDGETGDYIHAVNLTGSNANFIDRIFTGMNFGYSFFAMLNALWSWAVNFIIFVSNFDVPYIMDTLNLGSLQDTMNHLFIQREDGGVSVVLIIAAILFIASTVAMLVKRVVKGDAPLGAIFREFIMMCLAFVLCGACLAGGPETLSKTMSNASCTLLNALTNPDGNSDMALFQNDSGDAHKAKDSTDTLSALFSKIFIDMVIRNQFGVPVEELYIWKDGNTANKNWGFANTGEAEGVVALLTKERHSHTDTEIVNMPSGLGKDLFAISNRQDGKLVNADSPNLGYYWYAALSNVDIKAPYYEEDNRLKTRIGDRDYAPLYIIDFLSAVDSKWSDESGSSKARAIVEQFKHPVKDVGQMFACSLVSFCTVFALAIAGFYAFFGKVVFNIGALFIPILPVMLLIPFGNLRKTTLDLAKGWGIAALKMVVGQVYIVVVITFSVALCASGIMGMFLDCAFLIGMAFGSKKLFSLLNSTFGQHEPGFMRSVNRGFDKATGWMTSLASPRAMRDRFDNMGGKLAGRKKKKFGAGNEGGDIKDPNQNTLTNVMGANEKDSDAVANAKRLGQQRYDNVSHRSASELAAKQGIKGPFLDMLKKKEALAAAKGTGRLAKMGAAVGKAQQAILNSKAGAIMSMVPIAGTALVGTAKLMGATSTIMEHASIKNATQSLLNDVNLKAYELTHNIKMDGSVEQATRGEAIRNLGKAILHKADEDQFTFDKAIDAQKIAVQNATAARVATIQGQEDAAKAAAKEKAGKEASARQKKRDARMQANTLNKAAENAAKQITAETEKVRKKPKRHQKKYIRN